MPASRPLEEESVPRAFPLLLLVLILQTGAVASRAQDEPTCRGDCDASGEVAEGDLALALTALFSPSSEDICPALPAAAEETPGAADLLAAIAQRAAGCEPGAPLEVAPPPILRSFSGLEIAVPIAATGGTPPLSYSAEDLPEGAALDPETGVFSWIPSPEQAARYTIPVSVTDGADPPDSATTTLNLRITPLDSCSIPTCNPALGCSTTLPPLSEPCCTGGAAEPRVAEVVADCPDGAVVMIGRNVSSGFGRLENCDSLRLIAFTQAGVTIRIHLAARCFTTGQILLLKSRLETRDTLHTDREDTIVMQPTGVGFSQRINISLPVRDATMELEGQEANLSVELEDPFTGTIASESVRVILRHGALTDIPDVF